MGKQEGKRRSRVAVNFGPVQKEAFIALRDALMKGLELKTVQPDKPFVLRVDASDRAVGRPWSNLRMPCRGCPAGMTF